MKTAGYIALIALAISPCAMTRAQRDNDQRTPTAAKYAFSCQATSQLSLTPVSFNVGLNVPAGTGSQTGGAGAGKVTFTPFVVTFPMNAQAVTLLQMVETGQHFTSCELLETVHSVAPGAPRSQTFHYAFSLVLPTAINFIGSDSSNTASGGTDVPTGLVQATFEYGALQVEAQ